jgi:hypothetical protein
VVDINNTPQIYSEDTVSALERMGIQLRCQLESFESLGAQWIAILDTPTNGPAAILNFNTSVWPPSIRRVIRDVLLKAGGVPLESPARIAIGHGGRACVQPVTKAGTKSIATTAEPAMVAGAREPKVT